LDRFFIYIYILKAKTERFKEPVSWDWDGFTIGMDEESSNEEDRLEFLFILTIACEFFSFNFRFSEWLHKLATWHFKWENRSDNSSEVTGNPLVNF
jgi:hypothetical protein